MPYADAEVLFQTAPLTNMPQLKFRLAHVRLQLGLLLGTGSQFQENSIVLPAAPPGGTDAHQI
jgi:hypothetical protein